MAHRLLERSAVNRSLSLALIAAVLLATPLHATITRAVAFDRKVDDAQSIILGTCVSQESRWDSAHRFIVTYSTFDVEKTLKGFPAQRVTIVTPGGTVGSIHQDTIGVPRFRENEQHVVFVRDTRSGPTVLYF